MSRKIRFLMIFKKVGGSHEDAECNGSEFGEPSSDSGWCLCRARLARLVVVEVLMGLVLLLLLLEEYGIFLHSYRGGVLKF